MSDGGDDADDGGVADGGVVGVVVDGDDAGGGGVGVGGGVGWC